jgi:hypothetical protein
MASTTIVRNETIPDGVPAIDPSHHAAIEEQVGRLVASHLFRHSKHYPGLLRYVVDQSLKGRAAQLKERVLGFEVFGRDPNYDTNSDPVVRNSACEVRKRIAQYYLEPGHEAEIRIELPAGSYVPEFHFPEPSSLGLLQAATAQAGIPPVATVSTGIRSRNLRLWLSAAVLTGVVLTAASLYTPKDALDQFWGPVWSSSDSVILGVSGGGNPSTRTGPDGQPSALDVARNDRIAFSDSLTLARLTGLLGRNKKNYDIRRQATFSLADLQKEPAVLIGGFNNGWSMRLADRLRFTLEHYPQTHLLYIRDRQNPSARDWTGDPELPYSQLTEDYAIVSRVLDDRTERMVVMIAGMGKDGTIAAGEFVTTPRYMEALEAKAPSGWDKKNLQVVLGTEIVNGNPGPPRMLAVRFW